MSDTVIVVIGVSLIIIVSALSVLIPQLMVKSVGKRMQKYKMTPDVPVEKKAVEIVGKRCRSFEEGYCKSIRKAQDCEIEVCFTEENRKAYIEVPYGIYMELEGKEKGTLYLQNGVYRNFIKTVE